MPRNNSRRNNRPKRRANNGVHNGDMQKLSSELVQISESVQTNRYGYTPQVVDPQRPMLSRHATFNFWRSADLGSITTSATLDTFGAYQVALSTFPASSDFTALFDEYRMMFFVFLFEPINTGPFTLYTVLDYDDANVPVQVTALRQYPSLASARSGTLMERRFVPAIASSTYISPTTTGYSIKKAQWLDAAYPDVPHYGVKYAIPAVTGQAATLVWRVTVSAMIQCRSPR